MRKIADQHRISKSTLQKHTKGATSVAEFNASRQKLTPEEETAITGYIHRLQAWGWPGYIEHIKSMAQELYTAKGDIKPLGIN